MSVRGLPDGLLHQLQCGLGGSGRGHVMSGFVCEQLGTGGWCWGLGWGTGCRVTITQGKQGGEGGAFQFEFQVSHGSESPYLPPCFVFLTIVNN